MKLFIILFIMGVLAISVYAAIPTDRNSLPLTLKIQAPPSRDSLQLLIDPVDVSAPVDSCTYTSGDWNIDCSDDCILNTDEDLGGNNIFMTGTGTVTVNGALSNFNSWEIHGTSAAAQCLVRVN